ncbi:MAG: anthranilate phosphoribosyltransferase, partial [Actinomycetota bacterium]|nr:anthranilate phosphoribosyltransferase [Actinomycetota bacterium]
ALADILDGTATPAQMAGFIVGLRQKGETVEELSGMIEAMLAAAERVTLPDGMIAVDTCGTGGSPSRSQACFNVSTIAGLVIAGAGAKVCKHGGRAASATSSSGDLLEALGVVIELGPAGVAACVVEAGFGFCFAPRYHPGMRHAGPVRRELGVPTTFNFLGPLANPAGVTRQVLGVSDPQMATRMIGVLQARGADRALVVYGHDGLDELTTTTTSTVHELRDGEVRTYAVDPADLGIEHVDASALLGGDAARNLELATSVLAGDRGAHRDIVLLNAAAGLVAAGVVDELADGYEAAAASIDGGAATAVLERAVTVSQRAKAAEPASS